MARGVSARAGQNRLSRSGGGLYISPFDSPEEQERKRKYNAAKAQRVAARQAAVAAKPAPAKVSAVARMMGAEAKLHSANRENTVRNEQALQAGTKVSGGVRQLHRKSVAGAMLGKKGGRYLVSASGKKIYIGHGK